MAAQTLNVSEQIFLRDPQTLEFRKRAALGHGGRAQFFDVGVLQIFNEVLVKGPGKTGALEVIAQVDGGISKGPNKAPLDTIVQTDVYTRVWVHSYPLSDTFTLAEVFAFNLSRVILDIVGLYAGTAYLSNGTGNWSSTGTWSPAGVPRLGDKVTIQNGHTVTVDVNSQVGTGYNGALTVNAGGTLSIAASITLGVNGGVADAGSITYGAASILLFLPIVTNVFTDVLARSLSVRTFVENATPTEVLTKAVTQLPSDVLSVLDAIAKGSGLLPIDTFTVQDTFTRQWVAARVLLDSAIVLDMLSKQPAKNEAADAVSVVEAFLAQFFIHSNLSDTYSLSDVLVKAASKMLADSVTPLDTFARTLLAFRTLADVAVLADAISKQPGLQLLDVTTPNDSFGRQWSALCLLVDAAVVSDAIGKQPGKNTSDMLGVVDQIAAIQQALVLAMLDSYAPADALLKAPTKVVADSIPVLDAFTRALFAVRTFVDVSTMVDSILKSPGLQVADVDSIIDGFATQSVLYRTWAEVFSLLDVVSKQPGKSGADTLAVVDAWAENLAAVRTFLDVFTMIDNANLFSSGRPTINGFESVPLSDISVFGVAVALSEAASLLDTVNTGRVQGSLDTFTLVDSYGRQATRTFVEVVAVLEYVSRNMVRGLLDGMGLFDFITRGPMLSVGDILAVGDSAMFTPFHPGGGLSFADGIALADNYALGLTKALLDAIALGDVVVIVTGGEVIRVFAVGPDNRSVSVGPDRRVFRIGDSRVIVVLEDVRDANNS